MLTAVLSMVLTAAPAVHAPDAPTAPAVHEPHAPTPPRAADALTPGGRNALTVPAPVAQAVAPPAPTVQTPPPPTTGPIAAEKLTARQVLIWSAVCLVPALIMMFAAGVFRRDSIHRGRARIDPYVRLMPLLVVTLIGGGVWFFTQVAYGAIKAVRHAQANPGQTMGMEDLGVGDYAFLATVPSLIALAILLIGDGAAALLRAVGLTAERIVRNVLFGILGGVIVVLLMQAGGALLQFFYQVIGYEHPNEHELLGAMKTAPRLIRIILVIGACVMAPLFEELLFRGHIQTVLARMFMGGAAGAAPPWAPGMMGGAGGGLPPMAVVRDPRIPPIGEVLPLPPLGLEPPTPVSSPSVPLGYADQVATAPPVVARRRLTWLAVLITSVVFAVVHPLWTAPLIFVLSICLGYAYERTGSLWVPIIMHAMFNTSSTIVFLNMP